jgi:hypothetical protein
MSCVRPRFIATACLLAALVGAACGSSTPAAGPAAGSAPGTHGWSKSGYAALQAAKARLRAAFPGQCANNFTYERAGYVSDDNRILKTLVPDAVGQCDVGTENLEISVFPDAKTRDTFITQRVTRLCARGASKNLLLPPIPWITYGAVAMQPDTVAGAQRMAAKLGAHAEARGCKPLKSK